MKNTFNPIQTPVLNKESNVRTIVLAGFAILAVLVALYVYFVGKIVFDVVARRSNESVIQKKQSEISAMQVAYLNDMRGLDLSQATTIGLAESHDTLYASRPSAASQTVGMLNGN